MTFLCLLSLALQEEGPAVLRKIEECLLQAKFVTVKFVYEASLADPRNGEIQIGEHGRLRITMDSGQTWTVCDGKQVAHQTYWSHSRWDVRDGPWTKPGELLVRAGPVQLLSACKVTPDGQVVLLGQDAASRIEVKDLRLGPDAKDSKSVTYTLRSSALQSQGDLHVQLWYDPPTYRLLKREACFAGQKYRMRETYSNWSFAAETPAEAFTVPPPPRFGARVRGSIATKNVSREHGASVGCLGAEQMTVPWSIDRETLSSLPPFDLKTVAWDPRIGMAYGFKKVPPGHHLVYVHWGERYFDWRWIEVKDGPNPTVAQVDFCVDPLTTGSVEVGVPGSGVEWVMFVPADEEGGVPTWSPRLVGKPLSAKVKDRKALFLGMRPGKYVFYGSDWEWDSSTRSSSGADGSVRYTYHAPRILDEPLEIPRLRCPAEVKAKTTTRIELK